jgi:hypothetical protein
MLSNRMRFCSADQMEPTRKEEGGDKGKVLEMDLPSTGDP